MRYKTEKDTGVSAYMQLYSQIKKDIVEGAYHYGARLPSKRLASEEAGVSVITVEHAYRLLCDEGYAESRERSGYFVIYKKDDFNYKKDGYGAENGKKDAPVTSSHAKSVLHTSDSEFPFSVLSRTMRKVISEQGERILERSPKRGTEELCGAIAGYLARSNGIKVRPEQIVVGAGAEYLYGLLVRLFGSDRIFALEDPSYENIRRIYASNGVKCEALKLGADGILSEELEKSRADVLHVTPFNSYPSGVTASASKRNEYLRFAEKRGAYIIEDNYDSELTVSTKNEDTLFSLSENGSVVYLNTFSRTVAHAIRVGYAVLPEKLLPLFEEKVGFYSCAVPVFEQLVLAELIESGDFERHVNRVRRARRKNKNLVI